MTRTGSGPAESVRATQRLTPALGATLSIAGLTWLLIELWRAWTPGLITIFGRAAETPPELIGLFALGVMGTPLLLLALSGRVLVRRHTAYLLSTAVALAARIVIPFLDGNRPLLWTASVGVAAGVLSLAIAAARLGSTLLPGLFAGVAAAATTHAALGTWGAVWRTDWAEIACLTALVAAVVAGLLETRSTPSTAAPTWLAWVTLPVLLVAGMTLANTARGGVAFIGGPVVVAVAATIAALLANRVRPSRPIQVIGAVLFLAATAVTMLPEATVDGIPGRLPMWTILGFAVGMPAAAVLLSGAGHRERARRAPALAVGGGAVIFTALLFAVFAGYDMGYRADWVVPLVATVVAVVAVARGTSRGDHGDRETLRDPGPKTPGRAIASAVGAITVSLLLAGLGPFATLRPLEGGTPSHGDGNHRVMAWNLRMGYGINGTFRPVETAELIRASGADIVLLSEIDRGWLLNGGQDQLRILARLLGMHAKFAPAADQMWGDAVLSVDPLGEATGHPFPTYDSLTGAQALAVNVLTRSGELRVISTHLQPDAEGPDSTLRQATDLAAIMAASRTLPTIAGGDLNTQLDDKAWQVLLDTGYTDALASARPMLTSSSDRLEKEIDHILVSPGLTATRPQAVQSLLSDHLPVVVDIRVR